MSDPWEEAAKRHDEARESRRTESEPHWSDLSEEAQRWRNNKMMEDYKEAAQAELKKEELKRGKRASRLSEVPRTLVGRNLASVEMHSIEWLWTGWIPKGYITLVAGETGAAKSTILADIAARVTTGAPWPGEYDGPSAWRAPERVLWLGSEDSIEEMTVPRLTACGADLERVIQIEGVSENGEHATFSLQDDLTAVAKWLEFAKNEGQPFAMLVIDPVTSYLPGQRLRRVDLNDAGQLRTVLEPWLKLADKHNIAIVCVTHFAKDTTRSMLHRVLGSAAFTQTCRSLCAVIQQPPTDTDGQEDPHAKVLMQVKVNLPEHPGGAWRFRTERTEVGTDRRNGRAIFATRPDWEELDPSLTPNNAVGRSRGPKSQYSAVFGTWLKALFQNYPNHEWLAASVVRRAAIDEKVVSESWWAKHSGDHMERRNEGGEWQCRPKQTPTSTQGGVKW